MGCSRFILVFHAASEAVKCVETNVFSLIDEKSKPKIWRYELKSVTLHPLIKQSGIVIHCDCKTTSIAFPLWRDGRVVECTGLENRRTERYRGFESLSLRNVVTLSSDLLFSLRAPQSQTPYGEMAEWSNAPVLKTGVLRGTGGSNPSLSAKISVTSCKTTSYADFSFKGAPNLRQNFSGNRTNVFNPPI